MDKESNKKTMPLDIKKISIAIVSGAPNRKTGFLIQLKDLKNTLQIKEITLENDLAKKN